MRSRWGCGCGAVDRGCIGNGECINAIGLIRTGLIKGAAKAKFQARNACRNSERDAEGLIFPETITKMIAMIVFRCDCPGVVVAGTAPSGRDVRRVEGGIKGNLVIGINAETLAIPGIKPVEIEANRAAVAIQGVGFPGVLAIRLDTVGKGSKELGEVAVIVACHRPGRTIRKSSIKGGTGRRCQVLRSCARAFIESVIGN